MEFKTAWLDEPWICGVFVDEVSEKLVFGDIQRLYVMFVIDPSSKETLVEYALEQSVSGTFWGASLRSGAHYNYGPQLGEVSLDQFVTRAKEWMANDGKSILGGIPASRGEASKTE